MTLTVGIVPAFYNLNQSNSQTQSLVFCKMWNYIFQISLMLSRWFVVFACIDRYALTSDKIRLRNFAKPKVAYWTIIAIITIWSIICSHRLIFYEIHGSICEIANNMGAALYHSAYVIIGGGLLPVTIMILCTYFIRRNLARRKQKRMQLFLAQYSANSLDQQLLKILFIQIICYIIFIIPQLCNLVFGAVSIAVANQSMEYLAVQQFVAFVAELILYLFPVTSFYLYTLTSRSFRKELMKFFQSIHIYRSQRQVAATLDSNVHCNLGKQQATVAVIVNRTIHPIDQNKTTRARSHP